MDMETYELRANHMGETRSYGLICIRCGTEFSAPTRKTENPLTGHICSKCVSKPPAESANDERTTQDPDGWIGGNE